MREITLFLERLARGQSGHTVKAIDPKDIETLDAEAIRGSTTLTVEGRSVFRLADGRLFHTIGADEIADVILPIPGRGTPTRLRSIEATPAILTAVQRYLTPSKMPAKEAPAKKARKK